MLVPPEYRPRDPAWVRETVRRHPLAVLVTNGDHGPFATHLPVVPAGGTLGPGTGETGLVGVELVGHMNRRNPHWAALGDGSPGLLMFRGPDGYVSPTVYRTTPAAPTWNFTVVHLRGTPERIESREQTLEVVTATVGAFERDHGTGWDMAGSLEYFEEILAGVGAFRFQVTTAQAMFKLSQDKPVEVRQALAGSFTLDGSGRLRALAEAMYRYGGTVAADTGQAVPRRGVAEPSTETDRGRS
jgi:transcriptional regulator